MKDEILKKAAEMFINYGFKSVTMDDIATAMGISKKTIYSHYKNKTALVEGSVDLTFDNICFRIKSIIEQNINPIDELFTIRGIMLEYIKEGESSPQYQLQKYYPEIFQNMHHKQFDFMLGCVSRNLTDGIEQGLYRSEIDIDFITRIYFTGVVGIKDENVFPILQFKPKDILEKYLDYHLRAIVTEKGYNKLQKIQNSNEN